MYDWSSENYLSLPVTDAEIDDTFELLRNECETTDTFNSEYVDEEDTFYFRETLCYDVYSNGEMIAYADGVLTSEELTVEQYFGWSYASTQALSHKTAIMKLRADTLVERQVLVAQTASSFNMVPAAIGGVAIFAGAMFMKMRKSVDTTKDIKEPLV